MLQAAQHGGPREKRLTLDFSPNSGSKANDLCITLVFLSIKLGSSDQPFTIDLLL